MDWKLSNKHDNLLGYRDGLNQAWATRMTQFQPIQGGVLTLDPPQENHCAYERASYNGLEVVRISFRVRQCDENEQIIPNSFVETGTLLAWKE